MTGIVSPDPGAQLGSEADPEPPTVLRPEPGRGIGCSAGLGVTPGDRGRRERPRALGSLSPHSFSPGSHTDYADPFQTHLEPGGFATNTFKTVSS